ncbi:MAG: WD40 repeat domain-containing protein [Thermoguttaceae bacterium]|jgi:WD40 repeat protein|nr:WD40 repeat domain-containing protein [Thermoguttaceae bacterium]
MFKTKHYAAWVAASAIAMVVTGGSARELPTLKPWQTITLDQPGSDATLPVTSCVALSPDGQSLVTTGDDHEVRVWRAANDGSFVLLERLGNHADWVRAAAFRPDGAVLATAGDDRRVRLWDMPGSRTPVVLPGVIEGIRALAFSPDGRRLAIAGFDDRVRLYSSESGRTERELVAPGGDLRTVAFSPDGTQLAAAGRSGTVHVWRATDGKPIHELSAGSRRIRAMQYSDDGALLASGGDDGMVRLWSPRTGALEAVFASRPGRVIALCFCGPQRLAVGRSTDTIELWDLAAQEPDAQLAGHTGSVATLAYQTQSGTLVSGGFDCTIRLWNVQP